MSFDPEEIGLSASVPVSVTTLVIVIVVATVVMIASGPIVVAEAVTEAGLKLGVASRR